ncbi:MAG: hypothetical protein WAQ99_15655 [Pyrinomonadaceae bacterium]
MSQVILVAVLMISSSVASAQQASSLPLGWDLSYSFLLDANGVGQDEWLRKWVGPSYQSPAKKWITDWNKEPIRSCVLLEFPAPHAGERIIMWLVRTDNQAYYYERAEGNPLYPDDKPPREAKEALDSQAYDKFFDTVSSWQQLPRVKPEDTPKGAITGYQALLSLYSAANSRQLLLTNQDFAIYTKDFQS